VVKELRYTSGAEAFIRLAQLAVKESHFAFFVDGLEKFDLALGAERSISLLKQKGAFEKLATFQKDSEKRIAGYLGYDLKNDLEKLQSENSSALNFPEAVFFEPMAWVKFRDGMIHIETGSEEILERIENSLNAGIAELNANLNFEHNIQPETSKEAYLANAMKFRDHLKRGDIYEANYCIQFSGDVQDFKPIQQFLNLQSKTEAPFSVFAGFQGQYILSASPERYLKNDNGHLISQPIKGTKKRSADPELDKIYKEQLRQDLKEQSENVMIVDLVRNDLSRVAERGSVTVPELFGAQTFRTVHHLVSTVSARLNREKYNHWDAIRASFPMGSMTGAPKISAMKLIDRYESFKRSAYSGAFGWMDPAGDFDFNVMIRTIFYNENFSRVSFAVGSALTIKAQPESEYEECMLKAKALIESLESAKISNGLITEV
jgi:para-aminobenzoate synthetase component 1